MSYSTGLYRIHTTSICCVSFRQCSVNRIYNSLPQ